MATKGKEASSHFDADEMRAAQTEPTITIGSLLFRGRLLSAPEWFDWNDRLQQLRDRIEKGQATTREILSFYEGFFRALFPKQRFSWFAPDPIKGLMAEPLTVIEGAFDRFFEHQARANGVSRKSPSTGGNASSSSTPDAVGANSEG